MNPSEYERMYALEDGLWWYRGMRAVAGALLRQALAAGAAPARPAATRRRILDAGCGTGANAVWLERYGAVTACDVSPVALGYCRHRGLVRCVRASVEALPFAEQSFEIVSSFEVLQHRAVEDERAAVAEMARVLAPRGLLLLRLPAFPFLRGPHDDATHGVRRYRVREARSLLESTGLRVRYAGYVNSLLWPLAVSWRVARRLADGVRGLRAPALGEDGRATTPSDVRPLPSFADRALGAVLAAEARLVPDHHLPVGLSVIALAERPLDPPRRRP